MYEWLNTLCRGGDSLIVCVADETDSGNLRLKVQEEQTWQRAIILVQSQDCIVLSQ